MNTNERKQTPAPDGGNPLLERELLALSQELDALGALDRGSAPSGLTGSVVSAVVQATDITSTRAQIGELGAMDRASADPRLEDRVFATSRSEIVQPALQRNLRLVGTEHAGASRDAATVVVRRRVFSGRFVGLAAILSLGLTAGIIALALRPMQTPQIANNPASPTGEELALQIQTDMEMLFVAMQDSTGAESESATTPTEYNTDWMDELSVSSSGGGAS